MIIKELRGHSQCSLFLESYNNTLYVRKTSDQDYKLRLMAQCLKQDCFSDSTIRKPKIVTKDFEVDRSEFMMEYIDGPTFAEYIQTHSIDDILPKFQRILDWIESNNPLDTVETASIFDKLHSMGKSELKTKFINNSIYTAYCHGDLTLENIIIKNDRIYFIDFLDSPINCKEIDVAKLLQDILCGWSWRHSKMPISKCVLLYDEIQNRMPYRVKNSKKLLLLNLYRILPYADGDTNQWVSERIRRLENVR